MGRVLLFVAGVFGFVCSAAVEAQNKPNMTGSWICIDCAAGSSDRHVNDADWGQAFHAIQDAKTLTIVRRTLVGHEMTELFNRDGSESNNQRYAGQRSVSTAVWRGTKLVITTRDIQVTRTLSLGSDGLLTIETLRRGQAGREDRGGVSPGEWVATKYKYRKG